MLPLARSPRLLGIALTCYNPEKDPDRACGRKVVELLSTLAAGQRG